MSRHTRNRKCLHFRYNCSNFRFSVTFLVVFFPLHQSLSLIFSGVRVTRSLVLYGCFVDRCLSFITFSVGHGVVCSSSIYGFLYTLMSCFTHVVFQTELQWLQRLSLTGIVLLSYTTFPKLLQFVYTY